MDDTEVIDMAAEVFIRNAITNAADNTLRQLQDLLGITDGGYAPGTAIKLQEHLSALVKDYCDIFSDQRMNARM
jgi:hypothetical protein